MALSCTCADGKNCTLPTHKIINAACDEYVDSLRRQANPVEREFWQMFYGEVVPVNSTVIDAWRKYYDDMEALDRQYPHGPALYRRSNAVVPQINRRYHKSYYKERDRIKNHLHRSLREHDRTPTSGGYSEKDMAIQEHERALKPCDCGRCREYRY